MLAGKRMRKPLRDNVSFIVMTTLMFVVLSLSFTAITGSSGGIRYWTLHWIVLRQDVWATSVTHIYPGIMAALIALSLGLTWALSQSLNALRAKNSAKAWVFFILAIVIYIFQSAPTLVLS